MARSAFGCCLKLLLCGCAAIPLIAEAHHGKDFLLVQTAHLPQPGSVFAVSRQDYLAGESDELEFEPAVLLGVMDWAALEVHAHMAKEESESFHHESTAATMHLRFTPRVQPLATGLSMEYERPNSDEEAESAALAAICSYEISQWIVSGNVIFETELEAAGEDVWGYAGGFRYALTEHHAFGLEARGTFEGQGSAEMLAGYYGHLSPSVTFNIGVGRATSEGPDWTARAALILEFR